MKSYRCVVCDDNLSFLEQLADGIQKLFSEKGFDVVIQKYNDPVRLRDELQTGITYDIYFLDIDMPTINGLILAHTIRADDPDAVIVFVSVREDCVFDAIEVQPFAFVRKRKLTDLNKLVPRLISHFQHRADNPKLTLQIGEKPVQISPEKIMYIEAADKSIHIIFEDRAMSMRYAISKIEHDLRDYGFIRIHKSYLVNYRYIYSLAGRQIILDNQTILPIGRPRIKAVKTAYRRLIQ